MRVRTTSRKAAPSSVNAIPATLNARIAWLNTSGSQEPSGHTGPVPDTSTRSPARIAREKPIGPSNGESEVARRRSSAIGVPPVLRRQLGLDVDVLGLLERLEPLLAELAPKARLLVTAERPGVVVGQRVVDPDRAGLQLAHAAEDGLEVARVDVGAEPEARRVRELDRLVERAHRNDRRDRAERLLGEQRGGRG